MKTTVKSGLNIFATSNIHVANRHFCGLEYAPSSFLPIYKELKNYGILRAGRVFTWSHFTQVAYAHAQTHTSILPPALPQS